MYFTHSDIVKTMTDYHASGGASILHFPITISSVDHSVRLCCRGVDSYVRLLCVFYLLTPPILQTGGGNST